MKKLMILGGSILQIPAILKCIELGIQTCVLDYDEKAIGKKYADTFYNVSTMDKESILKVAEDERVDGIMTLASDRPIPIIAEIANILGLNSITVKAANQATDKSMMRKTLEEFNVPVPKFFIVHNMEEFERVCSEFGGKYITKPADNSGSRGVYLVDNKNKAKLAYQRSMGSSFSGCILVEEFMEGPEVSVETFTIEGQVSVIAITDKITSGPPYFVEIGHSQPSQLSLEIKQSIEKVAKSAIEALGITNGPCHVEIILTTAGPKIVEVGARLGGDCIATHLTPISTGVDIVALTIWNALGITKNIGEISDNAAMIRFMNFGNGIITNIEKENIEDDNVLEVCFTKQIGEKVGEIKCSNDRIGYIITKGSTLAIAEAAYISALKSVHVQMTKSELL